MGRSLRAQLLLSHLLPVTLMLVVMLVAVAGFFRLGQSIDRILRDNYKSVVAAQTMKETLERQDSAATFFLAGQTEKARKQYEANRTEFLAALDVERGNITESGEQEIADALTSDYAEYRRSVEGVLLAERPLSSEGARHLYFGTLEPSFLRLKDRAQAILQLNQEAIVHADEQAKREARQATLLSIGLTAIAALIAVVIAGRMITALMTPLVSLTRQAAEIGTGHLQQRIETRRDDEIGQLAMTFNEMAARLTVAKAQAQERLQRAERMSDAALENLYDPVLVTDPRGMVVHWNHAAEGLFGIAQTARGKPVRVVVRDNNLADAIERAVTKGDVSAHEDESGLSRFGERTYRQRVSPMRDSESGNRLGAVAVLEDVTYQREVDRLKTEFIGVASHELRTPVTSMLLSVQLLLEGAIGTLTPDQRTVVEAQQEDLQRLERMMRDLLDLTRLEAGATPPRFEVVNPKDLIKNAADSVEAQAQAKGITLWAQAGEGVSPVRGRQGSNRARSRKSAQQCDSAYADGGNGADSVGRWPKQLGALYRLGHGNRDSCRLSAAHFRAVCAGSRCDAGRCGSGVIALANHHSGTQQPN